MIVVVASVHHTGTHFLFEHLFDGWHRYNMGYDCISEPHGNGIVRIHCDHQQSQYLPRWLDSHRAVVPMRNPFAVATSWKAREKDLDGFGSLMEKLNSQWDCLKKMVQPYNPIYLPIDAPDRENWLAALNKELGLELQTDWPVVMSCNKSAELSFNDRQAVIEVMADGFFDRFGYEE